jgi:plastocyanin
MSLPRVLLVIPGLLAGLLIPAVIAAPKARPAGTVGMVDQMFAQKVVTIHRGERLTLVNNSRFVHVIGPGRDGHIISPVPGVPVLGFHLMQTNGVYTTGPWETLGTHYLTCSVHPEMTLKVVVTR